MITAKKPELIKPCPFCGGNDIGVFNLGRNGNQGVELCCQDCGARSCRGLNLQAAKNQWNRRVKRV